MRGHFEYEFFDMPPHFGPWDRGFGPSSRGNIESPFGMRGWSFDRRGCRPHGPGFNHSPERRGPPHHEAEHHGPPPPPLHEGGHHGHEKRHGPDHDHHGPPGCRRRGPPEDHFGPPRSGHHGPPKDHYGPSGHHGPLKCGRHGSPENRHSSPGCERRGPPEDNFGPPRLDHHGPSRDHHGPPGHHRPSRRGCRGPPGGHHGLSHHYGPRGCGRHGSPNNRHRSPECGRRGPPDYHYECHRGPRDYSPRRGPPGRGLYDHHGFGPVHHRFGPGPCLRDFDWSSLRPHHHFGARFGHQRSEHYDRSGPPSRDCYQCRSGPCPCSRNRNNQVSNENEAGRKENGPCCEKNKDQNATGDTVLVQRIVVERAPTRPQSV